jgi:hypothetical protein
MCPRERSIQGTPLRRILSGKYELGFLNSLIQGPGALLIYPSRNHHSPQIKPTLINDYYSSSKAVEA